MTLLSEKMRKPEIYVRKLNEIAQLCRPPSKLEIGILKIIKVIFVMCVRVEYAKIRSSIHCIPNFPCSFLQQQQQQKTN